MTMNANDGDRGDGRESRFRDGDRDTILQE